MEKLTNRQQDVLTFIKKFIVSNGYSPTVREIGKGLGLSSPATIQVHLSKLKEKGYISKHGSKNRTLDLNVINEYREKADDVISIPLLGKVTAGNPIEAIEMPEEYLKVPGYLIPKNKSVFSLVVIGDSMINIGILDGDTVLVEKKSSAKNGQIIIAMTEDNEVTLKKFYKEKNSIRLQPENNEMEAIILPNVKILGIVIGLYRKI